MAILLLPPPPSILSSSFSFLLFLFFLFSSLSSSSFTSTSSFFYLPLLLVLFLLSSSSSFPCLPLLLLSYPPVLPLLLLLFLFLFLPAFSLPSFPLLLIFFFFFLFFFLILLFSFLLFVFFLLLPALSLLLFIPPPLLPLSSLLLSSLSFPLLPHPPLLNVFYLNLSCEYSFCLVLLDFTCLRVSVCLSVFLLIKLFFKHIIMNCTTQTQYPDPVSGPGGCDHRVPGPGTRMKNGTRLCPSFKLHCSNF